MSSLHGVRSAMVGGGGGGGRDIRDGAVFEDIAGIYLTHPLPKTVSARPYICSPLSEETLGA